MRWIGLAAGIVGSLGFGLSAAQGDARSRDARSDEAGLISEGHPVDPTPGRRAVRAPFVEDQAAIRTLRANSNRGIAHHDMTAFTPIFANDAVFVWSDGSSAIGRPELARRFRAEFDNPNFVTLARIPETVVVSDQGVRAAEHGTWTGLRRDPHGETRYGGDYMAHWFKTADGWRVRGEVYVKLHCEGSLCTPYRGAGRSEVGAGAADLEGRPMRPSSPRGPMGPTWARSSGTASPARRPCR
jgi:ketosteroid isomerase-like protein